VDDDWAPYSRNDAQFDIETTVRAAVQEFGDVRRLSVRLTGWPANQLRETR
jgi:uncharacterized lipoprotein